MFFFFSMKSVFWDPQWSRRDAWSAAAAASLQAHTPLSSCSFFGFFLHQFNTRLQKRILKRYQIFINGSSSDLLSFLRSSGLQALPVPCCQLQHGAAGGWAPAPLRRGSWGCVCSQLLWHLSQLCSCCEFVLSPCWCMFCASATNASVL